jgi:hypothetical protein
MKPTHDLGYWIYFLLWDYKYSPAILDLMTLIFLDDNALCSLAKDERDGFILLDDNVKYK